MSTASTLAPKQRTCPTRSTSTSSTGCASQLLFGDDEAEGPLRVDWSGAPPLGGRADELLLPFLLAPSGSDDEVAAVLRMALSDWDGATTAAMRMVLDTSPVPRVEVALTTVLELRTVRDWFAGLHASAHEWASMYVAERLAMSSLRLDPGGARVPDTVFGPVEHMAHERLPACMDMCHILRSKRRWVFPVPPRTFQAPPVGTSKLVTPRSTEAHARFTGRTMGLLSGVLQDAVTASGVVSAPTLVVAGGAALEAVCSGAPSDDVDIMFVGCRTDADATGLMTRAIQRILGNVADLPNLKRVELSTYDACARALTLTIEFGGRNLKIQFIKRRYTSLAQVVLSFDIAPCRVLLTQRHAFCTRSAMHSIRKAVCIVDPLMATSTGRYIKYGRRKGFAIAVPSFPALPEIMLAVNSTVDAKQLLARNDLASVFARARLMHLKSTDYHGLLPCDMPNTRVSDTTPHLIFVEKWGPYNGESLTPPSKAFEQLDFGALGALYDGHWIRDDPTLRMYSTDGEEFLAVPQSGTMV